MYDLAIAAVVVILLIYVIYMQQNKSGYESGRSYIYQVPMGIDPDGTPRMQGMEFHDLGNGLLTLKKRFPGDNIVIYVISRNGRRYGVLGETTDFNTVKTMQWNAYSENFLLADQFRKSIFYVKQDTPIYKGNLVSRTGYGAEHPPDSVLPSW